MDAKRILIIDDNRTMAVTAERILQKKGYETASSLNGRDGLLKVQQFKPDAIILDIVMPGMDGYEVCTQLKQNPETAGIPIIFLSAKGNIDETLGAPAQGLKEINKAFESGANDFLHKPLTAAELIQAVDNLFALDSMISRA